MLSDRLRLTEYEHTQHAIEALRRILWAAPLLKRVSDAGDLQPEHKPLMFEVRFAFELHRAGVVAQYEYPTGVGGSSVDFRVLGPTEWLIEIVSIRASDRVKRATHQTGIFYAFQLSTGNPDPKQRPEAEVIRAEEKIGEKVWAHGSLTKFPIPDGAMHLILIDMRGYLDGGGHKNDYRQIAYGGRNPEATREWIGYSWEMSPGKREPIKGLFEEDNPLPAARLIQERIHFLGFVSEREYREGEMRDVKIAHYLANPHFFSTHADAEKAFASYPLRPVLQVGHVSAYCK